VIVAVLALIGGLIVGYAGQSVVEIGAPSHVSVSAGVMGSSGGIGGTQPVRVRLQVGVVNSGDAQVRVVGTWSDTVTTAVRGLTPSVIEVPGGSTGALAIDVALQCTWPSELTLPTLRLEEPNGEEQPLPLSGASALIDACMRGIPPARPIAVVSAQPVEQPVKRGQKAKPDRLKLVLNSPTGRPMQIVRLSAGSVPIAQTSDRPGDYTTAGWNAVLGQGGPTTLTLAAPATCPDAWLTAGVPSALRADLPDGSAVLLQVGRPLTSWLLDTACASDGSP
jgi:hypothetical protein